MSEQFLAAAQIVVSADTKPFRAQLEKELKKAAAEQVKVKVVPDTKAFAKLAREQLAALKIPPVSVLVLPDVSKFRAALDAEVKAAAAGATVPVSVVPVGGVAGAAASTGAQQAAQEITKATAATNKGTAAASRALTAEQALKRAVDAEALSRKRIVGDLSIEEKRTTTLTRQKLALKAATDAVSKAALEGNAAALVAAENLVRVTQAAIAKTEGTIARAAAPAAAAAARAAAREAELAAEQQLANEMGAIQAKAIIADKARTAAEEKESAKRIATVEAELEAKRAAILAETEALAARGAAASTRLTGRVRDESAAAFEEAERARVAARAKAEAQLSAMFAKREAEEKAAAARTAANAKITAEDQVRTFKASEAAFEREAAQRLAARQAELRVARQARVAPDLSAAIEEDRLRTQLGKDFAKSQRAQVESAKALALSETEDLAVSKRLSLSKRALANAVTAVTAAEERYADVLLTTDQALIKRADAELAAAQATKARAAENLRAAESEAVKAARAGSATKAFIAQSAAMLGLRGAALTANVAFIGTAASLIAVGASVKSAAKLSSDFNVFRVTAGATAEEMGRVRQEALKLGRDITLPSVSAADAAEAFQLLARAGLDVNDSIFAGRGVLQLATAAQIDNAQAVELTASALNAFGLAGDQAVHVADVLANAANDSQGSIVDMGIALQQAAAVGRQAGLSLEQTVAALTLFARNGLRGSDAGTSFRTAIIRLINPTKKAREVINRLGLSLRTTTGAINLNVFQEFADKTRDLSAAQRDQALAIIFGQDAIRGAAILAREGSRGINSQIESLDKQGTAAKLAAARMTGLTGSAENLKNQMAALGLSIGAVLIPPLKLVTDILGQAVSGLNTLIDLSKTTIEFTFGGGLEKLLKVADIGPLNDLLLKGGGEQDVGTSFDKVSQKVIQAQENLQKFRESSDGGAIPPALINDLRDAEKELTNIAKTTATFRGFKAVKASFSDVSPQIKKAIEDDIITPLEKVQLSSSALGRAFLAAVPKRILPGVGLAVASSLEEQKASTLGAVDNFAVGIRDRLEQRGRDVLRGAEVLGENIGAGVRAGILRSIAGIEGQLAGLDEALDKAAAAGDEQGQLRILRKRQKRLQRVIDVAGPDAKGDALKARRKAQKELVGVAGEIKSINEGIAADAKQAADDIKDAADKADQSFLDALAAGDRPLARRAARAAGTPDLHDDRAVLIAQRKRNLAKIALISGSVKDKKKATEQIDALRLENINLDTEIAAKTKEIAESGSTILGQRVELAGLRGNKDAVISLLKQVAARARKQLREAIRTKGDVLAARIANRTAINAIRDAEQEQADDLFSVLQQRIELAGLRGHENEQLKIIDRAIANRRKEIRRLKGLGKATLGVQLEIEQLIDQREEIKNTVDKEKEGTTAFELLQQAAETFNANAGNLVNGNQPFAGPTGFTADIAQFLIRRTATGGKLIPTGGKEKGELTLQDEGLIAALDRLRITIETQGGKGNRTTGIGTTPGGGASGTSDKAYFDAVAARKVKEARIGP